MDCSPSGSSVHGDTPGKNTRVSCPPPGDLSNPGIESRSLALQVDFLLSEPPGKPKNTVVGSQFLLQENFPTQDSNWGLLHCRQILYQLSYPGSPIQSEVSQKEKNKYHNTYMGSSDGKESTCNAGDLGSIPELGRSPGGGHGNPLQYSCL